MIKLAGVSEDQYLRAFDGETFDYWIYEDNVTHVGVGPCRDDMGLAWLG